MHFICVTLAHRVLRWDSHSCLQPLKLLIQWVSPWPQDSPTKALPPYLLSTVRWTLGSCTPQEYQTLPGAPLQSCSLLSLPYLLGHPHQNEAQLSCYCSTQMQRDMCLCFVSWPKIPKEPYHHLITSVLETSSLPLPLSLPFHALSYTPQLSCCPCFAQFINNTENTREPLSHQAASQRQT